MIVLENLDAGYTKGKPVLKNLNLRIDADDRIALLGANGNGKSTLMKLLSGRLPPLAGAMHKSGKLRVGYFAQFQTDELDVTQTPYAVMRHAMKTSAEAHIRAALAKFGFDKHKADTKVGELSGGEKARLLFCLMSYDAPHIMLLDEPTNHLDIDARQALTQALNAYSGAVILVSHDAQLVESVVDRLWLVADGTCKPFDDDLEAYRKLVVQQRKREREDVKQQAKNQKNDNKKKNDSLEKEAAKLEKKIGELKLNRDTVENDIANAFSANNTKQLKDLNTRLSELDAQLLAAEAELEALIVKL